MIISKNVTIQPDLVLVRAVFFRVCFGNRSNAVRNVCLSDSPKSIWFNFLHFLRYSDYQTNVAGFLFSCCTR